MSAVADAVFAAVFVVVVAVAVWPARRTVAVNRGACAGPSVQKFHSGGGWLLFWARLISQAVGLDSALDFFAPSRFSAAAVGRSVRGTGGGEAGNHRRRWGSRGLRRYLGGGPFRVRVGVVGAGQLRAYCRPEGGLFGRFLRGRRGPRSANVQVGGAGGEQWVVVGTVAPDLHVGGGLVGVGLPPHRHHARTHLRMGIGEGVQDAELEGKPGGVGGVDQDRDVRGGQQVGVDTAGELGGEFGPKWSSGFGFEDLVESCDCRGR